MGEFRLARFPPWLGLVGNMLMIQDVNKRERFGKCLNCLTAVCGGAPVD